MTLNAKLGGFMDFLAILSCRTHFSMANCTETNSDKHGQVVYEIFSIKRRFQ